MAMVRHQIQKFHARVLEHISAPHRFNYNRDMLKTLGTLDISHHPGLRVPRTEPHIQNSSTRMSSASVSSFFSILLSPSLSLPESTTNATSFEAMLHALSMGDSEEVRQLLRSSSDETHVRSPRGSDPKAPEGADDLRGSLDLPSEDDEEEEAPTQTDEGGAPLPATEGPQPEKKRVRRGGVRQRLRRERQQLLAQLQAAQQALPPGVTLTQLFAQFSPLGPLMAPLNPMPPPPPRARTRHNTVDGTYGHPTSAVSGLHGYRYSPAHAPPRASSGSGAVSIGSFGPAPPSLHHSAPGALSQAPLPGVAPLYNAMGPLAGHDMAAAAAGLLPLDPYGAAASGFPAFSDAHLQGARGLPRGLDPNLAATLAAFHQMGLGGPTGYPAHGLQPGPVPPPHALGGHPQGFSTTVPPPMPYSPMEYQVRVQCLGNPS